MDAIDLHVPGSVWDDVFNPAATGIPAERGWPNYTRHIRRGRIGMTHVYENLPLPVALDMIDHAEDWASGMTYGVDPEMAQAARRILTWVTKTRGKLET